MAITKINKNHTAPIETISQFETDRVKPISDKIAFYAKRLQLYKVPVAKRYLVVKALNNSYNINDTPTYETLIPFYGALRLHFLLNNLEETNVDTHCLAIIDSLAKQFPVGSDLVTAINNNTLGNFTGANAIVPPANTTDNTKVSLTGNETINGTKTFVESPIVPDADTDFEAVNFRQLEKKQDKRPNHFEWSANFDVFGIGYQDIEIAINNAFTFFGNLDLKLSETFRNENRAGMYHRFFYDFYVFNGGKSPHLQKTLLNDGKIDVSSELLLIGGKLIIRVHYNSTFIPSQSNRLLVQLLFTSPNFSLNTLNPIIKPYVITNVVSFQEQKQLPVTTTRIIENGGINKTISNLDDQHHFIFTNTNPVTVTLPAAAMTGMKFSVTQKGIGSITATGAGILLLTNLPAATTQGETRTFSKGLNNEWIVEGFKTNAANKYYINHVNNSWDSFVANSWFTWTRNSSNILVNSPTLNVGTASPQPSGDENVFFLPIAAKLKSFQFAHRRGITGNVHFKIISENFSSALGFSNRQVLVESSKPAGQGHFSSFEIYNILNHNVLPKGSVIYVYVKFETNQTQVQSPQFILEFEEQ